MQGKDHEEYVDIDFENENVEVKNDKDKAANTNGKLFGIHTTSFKDFMLKEELLKALTSVGFEHPSEVQQQCLPKSLFGVDILCQAKAGMGKTAVFVLTVLNSLETGENLKPFSCLVLALTRELALQIKGEFERFSKFMNFNIVGIWGGVNIDEQIDEIKAKKPNIIIGTPGRILTLTKRKVLDWKNIKHFILDECDKMLGATDMRADIQSIFQETPVQKQVMMYSATLSDENKVTCRRFLRKPFEVFVTNETDLILYGLQQYYVNLQENEKTKKLIDILDSLQFNQVVIFVSSIQRCITLNKILNEQGFPSLAIHSNLDQEERTSRFKSFKDFKKRIMVATDIFGRGIDVCRVNIVINYDMSKDSDTYLHRVGRAGRFGTKGLTITFISSPEDKEGLEGVQKRLELKVNTLPDQIDSSTYMG